MNKFPHLFSSLRVGNVTLKNRIIASPTSNPGVSSAEFLKKDNIAFYELRAIGGAAAVNLGDCIVHSRTGRMHPYKIPMDDPAVMPSLSDTARSIAQHGSIPSLELSHGGKYTNVPNLISKNTTSGEKPYGPSHEVNKDGIEIFEMPEALILEIIDSYGAAAARAKEAGFGMLVVHGGHGWLLSQFMSPTQNRRTDRFGGNFENRMRFTLMAIDSVRAAVGPGFPIEFRMSGAEYTNGGYGIDYGIQIAKAVEDKVDIIHVSAGVHDDPETFTITHPSMFLPHGSNVHLAAAVKMHVSKPVACVGGLSDPYMMEEIIASGQADIVEMSRSLMADPFLPSKARMGREDEIVKCMRCFVCMNTLRTTRNMKCTMNPAIGRELEQMHLPREAVSVKRVLVAGGGPGGMMAAITAAERGHKVILCEKSDRLGGQINCEAHVPFKRDLYDYCRLLERRVRQAELDLRLETEVTAELAAELAPDVIIAAVGATPVKPAISGIDNKKVLYAGELCDENSVLCNKPVIGLCGGPGKGFGKVAILGGGLVGCETAVHLKMLGWDVAIVEMLNDYAGDAVPFHKQAMSRMLAGVEIFTNTKGEAITDEGLVCRDSEGRQFTIEADFVLCSAGMQSQLKTVESLRNVAPEFFSVGDCVRPGQLAQVISGGYYAALDI